MIISRSPLRFSLAGGGSDIPDFYRENGGAVVSTSIDKYVFITINKKFDNGIRLAYSKTEEVAASKEIEHRLVRACLGLAEIEGGIEITTIADVPSRGSGLGSSSSFTVGLLQALFAYKGKHLSKKDLAEMACKVEIDICLEPIGKQDQYAAAFGSLNLYEFNQDDSVSISPILCKKSFEEKLNSSLLIFYTGKSRSASKILEEQTREINSRPEKKDLMKKIALQAREMRNAIEADDIEYIGKIMYEGWMLKKQLSKSISTFDIDLWYETAIKHGAIGGRLLGAGAGGFLAFLAPPERHLSIINSLNELKRMPIKLTNHGAQIIFYQPTE